MLGLRKVDPSTERFNEIFSAAASGGAAISAPTTADGQPKKVSAWPIITFLGLIFATPYLIMKLIGQVSTTAIEQCKRNLIEYILQNNIFVFFLPKMSARNPQTWVRPYAAEVVYNYKSTTPNELNVYPGQLIQLAPREVQQTHKLLNTGWALATIDNKTSGLVPINYVRRVESKPHQNQVNPVPEQQQQTAMIVPEMQPIAECTEKSAEMESKSNSPFNHDWNTDTHMDATTALITNQSNPELLHIDNAMMPNELKDL